MPVNVGQTEVAPLISVGKFTMINSKQMKNRGIKVVYMHGILRPMMLIWLNYISVTVRKVVTVVIGLTVSDSGFYTTSCHPCSECTGMMITAVVLTS